jgi:hypothetical protein
MDTFPFNKESRMVSRICVHLLAYEMYIELRTYIISGKIQLFKPRHVQFLAILIRYCFSCSVVDHPGDSSEFMYSEFSTLAGPIRIGKDYTNYFTNRDGHHQDQKSYATHELGSFL